MLRREVENEKLSRTHGRRRLQTRVLAYIQPYTISNFYARRTVANVYNTYRILYLHAITRATVSFQSRRAPPFGQLHTVSTFLAYLL